MEAYVIMFVDFMNSVISNTMLLNTMKITGYVMFSLICFLYIQYKLDYNRRKKLFSSPVYKLVLITDKSDTSNGYRYHPDRIMCK